MDWFYTKELTLKKRNSTLDDDSGFYVKNKTESSKTIICDVQPIDVTKDFDEAGKLIDAQYKVYCDIDSFITTNCRVIYHDTEYMIKKIIEWDDYLNLFIKAVK